MYFSNIHNLEKAYISWWASYQCYVVIKASDSNITSNQNAKSKICTAIWDLRSFSSVTVGWAARYYCIQMKYDVVEIRTNSLKQKS